MQQSIGELKYPCAQNSKLLFLLTKFPKLSVFYVLKHIYFSRIYLMMCKSQETRSFLFIPEQNSIYHGTLLKFAITLFFK